MKNDIDFPQNIHLKFIVSIFKGIQFSLCMHQTVDTNNLKIFYCSFMGVLVNKI